MVDQYNTELEREKRPVFLKVLCILTFISTGGSILMSMMRLSVGPFTYEEVLEQKAGMQEAITDFDKMGADFWVDYMQSVMRFSVQANDNHNLVMFLALLVASVGFIGALMMWRGQKIGFHLYIVYNIIGIASVYLYASMANIHSLNTIISVLFALLFILMYSRNLKWMR